MSLTNCARCGGDHETIEWRKLTNPHLDVYTLDVYTHWAPCPTNGEPIMMRIVRGG